MDKIPTAKEMSQQFNFLNRLLYKKKLIQRNTKNGIESAIYQLDRFKEQTEWEYIIKPSTPIKFVPTRDKKLGNIIPQVYLDVAVEPPKRNDFPIFKRLDTKIEIFDFAGKLHPVGILIWLIGKKMVFIKRDPFFICKVVDINRKLIGKRN